MEQNNQNPVGFSQKKAKSKSAKKNKNSNNQNGFQQTFHKSTSNLASLGANDKKIGQQKKVDFKSISNMAVQTPQAWNLRDYNKEKPKRPLSRSASVSNLQPRRIPFANYGWATKTKDLSLKPTHNALANKVRNFRHFYRNNFIKAFNE